MFKATKKVYMSILAILLVFITVVATTYAWVGILTYAQTDTFKLNLKTQDLENDFYLSISATDYEEYDTSGNLIMTTYSEHADEYEIKKQIIQNRGYSTTGLDTEQLIDRMFYSKYQILPVTTTRNTILKDEFHELEGNYGAKTIKAEKSNNFYKFDIYLSMEHRDGDAAITAGTNAKMDLILSDIANSLTGEINSQVVSNDFTYPSSAVYNPNNFGTISGSVNVDAASAARVALAVYKPILRTNSYFGTENPDKLFIYQGGTQVPTYNETTDTYSFGGILPEEYNLALYEHKKNRDILPTEFNIPADNINRGDLELIDDNDELFDDSYGFGVKDGKKTKVKITVYFWFEGWDADCFEIIDAVKVRINLNFATNANTEI